MSKTGERPPETGWPWRSMVEAGAGLAILGIFGALLVSYHCDDTAMCTSLLWPPGPVAILLFFLPAGALIADSVRPRRRPSGR